MADVTFERFGGLNLVQDPQEAGAEQALSTLNAALERNGRVRTRDGYDEVYSASSTGKIRNMHPVSQGTVLAALDSHSVRVVDLAAGTSAANVALSSRTSSFASIGSGIYFTDGTSTQVRKFVAPATFSSPAGLSSYEGNYLAVQPLDDRLVIADANNTSKLWFSDPATPETIDTSNFLELTPGDGEAISGMEVFGTELFVFKHTKFFVFYGNSTDETGGVIFNYRMVDVGIGCNAVDLKMTATDETGVYFVASDGVYRTTGGAPVKVSGPIDPVFKGTNLPIPAPFSSVLSEPVDRFNHLAVATGRLWLMAVPSGHIQFVMNLQTGQWTVSDITAYCALDGALVADGVNSVDYWESTILGGSASTTASIYVASNAYSDDNGTPISWHHQSGFYDLGSQHSKRTRRSTLWGSGSPTVSVFTDHGTTDANAAAVTLGTSPAVARGWHTKAYRGVLFSHKLSGSGAVTVHRIGHVLADERASS